MSLFQCKIGPAAPELGGQKYIFELDQQGRYVCEVTDEEHKAILRARTHAYEELDEGPE